MPSYPPGGGVKGSLEVQHAPGVETELADALREDKRDPVRAFTISGVCPERLDTLLLLSDVKRLNKISCLNPGEVRRHLELEQDIF